jgi:hypothetical protein
VQIEEQSDPKVTSSWSRGTKSRATRQKDKPLVLLNELLVDALSRLDLERKTKPHRHEVRPQFPSTTAQIGVRPRSTISLQKAR